MCPQTFGELRSVCLSSCIKYCCTIGTKYFSFQDERLLIINFILEDKTANRQRNINDSIPK